ncbi:MAG TPA: LrgB family protein [Verrucomicrobiae bacterium]|jgi:putative effector of murein hydrolase|nr:LrgB family protein [Verrucomicrobiae bacterium]
MTAPGVSAFCVAVTLGAYLLSRVLARRYPSPLTTPVFCSTALIIAVLTPSGVGVADYEPAKRLMVLLLGPATVSLAVPLYKNRHTLLRNTLPALVGLGVGSLATLGAAVVIARLLGLPEVIRASISIKSVTTPIAVELAPIVHGNPTLTAAFVIATGMIGTMLGPWLMNRVGIHDPLSRGLALGTISHGQGTAQAVTEGELQGAAAGIAMGLAAVFTSCIAPFLVPILR